MFLPNAENFSMMSRRYRPAERTRLGGPKMVSNAKVEDLEETRGM